MQPIQERLTARIEKIDSARVFLFFVGLLCTAAGIVQGLASNGVPTNPEEAKLFSFTVIKALGLSSLPTTECLGTTLVLYALSHQLDAQARTLIARFEDALYETVYLDKKTFYVAEGEPGRISRRRRFPLIFTRRAHERESI